MPQTMIHDDSADTIFLDRALRFKSLTLPEGNEPAVSEDSQPADAFKIRIAKLSGRRDAGGLVARRYATRGYQIPAQKQDPFLTTFLAYDEGRLVGTVGVRFDSTRGLYADRLYKNELDALRKNGSRLFEFTRLAVDRNVASKPVLAGLFHTAYLYAAVIHGHTHAVIEVNPRHVTYYTVALRFEPIGPERINESVDAPAVLLYVPMSAIADGLDTFAGKPDVPGARRSLFLYAFPAKDAVGVLGRLQALPSANPQAVGENKLALSSP